MPSEKRHIYSANIGKYQIFCSPKPHFTNKLGLSKICKCCRRPLQSQLPYFFEDIFDSPGFKYERWLIFQHLIIWVLMADELSKYVLSLHVLWQLHPLVLHELSSALLDPLSEPRGITAQEVKLLLTLLFYLVSRLLLPFLYQIVQLVLLFLGFGIRQWLRLCLIWCEYCRTLHTSSFFVFVH